MQTIRTRLALALLCTLLFTIAGCARGGLTTREKGTLGGAALGAGAGALSGEATGSGPGKGALISGTWGGLGGALRGNTLQSHDEARIAQQQELERQCDELERQWRIVEELQRDRYYDTSHHRERYRDPYYDFAPPRY